MLLISEILVLIAFSFRIQMILTQTEETDDWSLNKLLPKDYNKQMIPSVNGSQITITIGIEVLELIKVVESEQCFVLDLVLHQKWKDHRLVLPKSMKRNDNIILDSTWTSKLWTPDIYFSNAIESKILNVVNPVVYFSISNDMFVTQSIKMNVKFQCKMDLSHYPQDVQHCPIEIISLTRNNKSLDIEWDYFKSPPLDDNPKFRLRQTMIGMSVRHNHLGYFNCLTVNLKLVRRLTYYMIRVYAPTFLTTISSFVGFWIPVLGWPARVALLVTPLLTLITQNVNINSELNVSYVVALHWWMTFCIFFVFMSLIEFAVAISWAWMANDKKASRTNQGCSEESKCLASEDRSFCFRSGRIVGNVLFYVFGNIDYTKDPLSRNKVDYASRLIFPFTYIIFVTIYILATVCPWAVHYNW